RGNVEGPRWRRALAVVATRARILDAPPERLRRAGRRARDRVDGTHAAYRHANRSRRGLEACDAAGCAESLRDQYPARPAGAGRGTARGGGHRGTDPVPDGPRAPGTH